MGHRHPTAAPHFSYAATTVWLSLWPNNQVLVIDDEVKRAKRTEIYQTNNSRKLNSQQRPLIVHYRYQFSLIDVGSNKVNLT
jgi:hypothetical protein